MIRRIFKYSTERENYKTQNGTKNNWDVIKNSDQTHVEGTIFSRFFESIGLYIKIRTFVSTVIRRSQELQSNIPKQDKSYESKIFCLLVISPADCSTETPINHFNEPFSLILDFEEKYLKESVNSEDIEKYHISSTRTRLKNLLPCRWF